MSIQILCPFVIELLVIMYNFTCKYSEFADPLKPLEVIQWELNCKIWGSASNSVTWRQLDLDMLKCRVSCTSETADHSELGSTPTTADHAELGGPCQVKGVLQHHPRCDKTTRRSCNLGAALVFVWSQAGSRGVSGSWKRSGLVIALRSCLRWQSYQCTHASLDPRAFDSN